MFFGLFNNIIRQSQLSGNGKSITLSRYADKQAVSGAQGFYVKFAGGIFHARRRKGIDLQFAVMGGCHGADSLCVKMGENGNGQSCALSRVCSGAKLVEKHQRVPVCFFQKTYHIGHVGGKGTERLLNALLVPDVRINLPKDTETGMVKGRNVKPGLPH